MPSLLESAIVPARVVFAVRDRSAVHLRVLWPRQEGVQGLSRSARRMDL